MFSCSEPFLWNNIEDNVDNIDEVLNGAFFLLWPREQRDTFTKPIQHVN